MAIHGLAPRLDLFFKLKNRFQMSISLQDRKPALISVVLPCFNEQETIVEMHRQLSLSLQGIGAPYEIIFVDDGSVDRTWTIISELALVDPNLYAYRFSRNFGQQLAYRAGLDGARGDVVITMDSDLQDPPVLIPELLSKWQKGADIVYAQRRSRAHDSWSKRFFATNFYRLIPYFTDFSIPYHVGEFRLMDRRVVEVIKTMNERRPFMRGMVAWTGYPSALVPYDRPMRFAGATKFPFRKSLALAFDALVGFSSLPLRAALPLGVLSLVLSTVVSVFMLFAWILDLVSGFGFAVACLWCLISLNLLFVGILGRYLAQIADQSNSRPLYIISESIKT